MAISFIAFGIRRHQVWWKMALFTTLCVLSIIFALTACLAPGIKIVMGWLSLVWPTIVLLISGFLLVLLSILQGYNLFTILLVLLLLGSLTSFGASIALLTVR